MSATAARRVFANRRQATGFDEHDRVAAMRRVIQRMHVGSGELARLRETALGNQWAAAAHIRGDGRLDAGGTEDVNRGHANFRIAVISKSVCEKDCSDGPRLATRGGRLLAKRVSRPLRQRSSSIDAGE